MEKFEKLLHRDVCRSPRAGGSDCYFVGTSQATRIECCLPLEGMILDKVLF
jgi:hypothetical protein